MYNFKADFSEAKRRVRRLIQRTETLPWHKAGEIVRKSVQHNFVVGGNPDKWQPRKVSVPWPILMKSKRLFNSIYNEPIPNGVAIGTRVPYQAVHNFGYPPRNIAQREYLLAQKEDIDIIKELFANHVTLST